MAKPPGRISPWGSWSPFLGVSTPSTNAAAGIAAGTGTAGAAAPSAVSTGFTHVTVTRDYDLADGQAPIGTVYFTPSTWLVNDGVTVPAATVAVPLDADGAISLSLVSNFDAATTPTGSYYTVREEIVGQPQRSYRITVPADTSGFTVDLGYLEVVYPAPHDATTVHAGFAAGTGSALGVSTAGAFDGGYGVGGYGVSPYGGGTGYGDSGYGTQSYGA